MTAFERLVQVVAAGAVLVGTLHGLYAALRGRRRTTFALDFTPRYHGRRASTPSTGGAPA